MGFHEKPAPERLSGLESSSRWVAEENPFLGSMGIYLFKPDVLSDLLMRNPEFDDFGKEIIPCALGQYRMTSYPFNGYWSDIGTIKSFFKANIDLAMPNPAFDMYSQFSPLYTRARALPGARMKDCSLHNTIVCDASDLDGAVIRNSVIGIRSYVGRGCVIEDAVLMGADFWRGHHQDPAVLDKNLPPMGIGEGSVIRRAIIDKNARIGRRVHLMNEKGVESGDGESWFIRDGIIVIPKGAVIPDGTVV
jgi:glucose-1-phosphate adenylyltransferase